jgi:UDPglucose 6-dehydrogenase
MKQAKPLLPNVRFCEHPYEAAEGADALVIVTEWDAYRALDLGRIKQSMKNPVVVDLRNIYRPEEMIAKGFRYSSIGRPSAQS